MEDTFKKIRILIVDDEPLIRQSLYDILRIDGYYVQMCDSAEEALKMIEKDKIDLVVTDMLAKPMAAEQARRSDMIPRQVWESGYLSWEGTAFWAGASAGPLPRCHPPNASSAAVAAGMPVVTR